MTSSRSESVRAEPVEGLSTGTESEQVGFFVYMLRCGDGSYYTGHTDNLGSRMAAHDAGEILGYSRDRRPVTLVYSERFSTRVEALGFERRIKRWSRRKKRALIRGDWDLLQRLARGGGATGSPLTNLNPRDLF